MTDLTPIRRLRSEPKYGRVLDNEQATRGNESSEKMVINREIVDTIDIAVECWREPYIFSDDLAGSLDILPIPLHSIRDAPARSTTRSRLLRDGEGNSGLEGASHKGTLAIAGATSHSQPFGVDASLTAGLQYVTVQERNGQFTKHKESKETGRT